MKIIHFSDIHIGGWVKSPTGYFDKRLIGSVNYKFRRHKHIKWHHFDQFLQVVKEEKPDVVCFTGDLVSISDSFEFEKSLTKMKPLVENKDFHLLCVPGNHDRYVKNRTSVQKLNEIYFYLNRGEFTLDQFPIKKTIGDIDFYLIDQSYPMSWTSSNGIAKLDDIKKIKQWSLEKQKKKVLLGHFPLRDSQGNKLGAKRDLKNQEHLYKLLQSNAIDIALCGHNHRPFIRQEKTGSLEICAGSLTMNGRVNKLIYQDDNFKQEWIIC